MTPQSFLDFFKSKTGRLTVFAILFGAGLALIGAARTKNNGRGIAIEPADLGGNTNKSQVVQTISKDMDVFHPPTPKPDPPTAPPSPPKPPPQPEPEKPIVTKPTETPEVLALLTLLAETSVAEPKTLSPRYAPFGRLIPCQTVITIDSASIRTPIVGLITENIYHAGQLIVPAGTEVHGTAQTDRSRERIASGTAWRLVWQTGEELSLNALALDREFDNSTNQTGWGITDGSAGIRGRLIKSDNLDEIKLFAATFLGGAAASFTEKEQTIFGTLDRPSLNNAPLKGAQQVLAVYAQRIHDSIQRDGFYVRIPSGKQFYLYVLQTIDRADAQIGGKNSFSEETADTNLNPTR